MYLYYQIRYTKGEINQILKAKNKFIFSINVSDRFGDLGLTGISIIEINNEKKVAEIDIFLLSCRIIGRQIEKEFLNQIIQYFKNKNVYKIIAIYIPSSKNAITSSFYRDFGFTEVSSNHKKTIFEIDIKNYQSKKYNLFEVKFG